MTEIEKLRSLLAEAREWLGPGCGASNCPEGPCALRVRIDAALAEPVVAEYTFRGGYIEDASGDRWWSAELLAKTERERDEARAEVERLRNALAAISLDEYESTSSASEKVHGHARIARKALYGDVP